MKGTCDWRSTHCLTNDKRSTVYKERRQWLQILLHKERALQSLVISHDVAGICIACQSCLNYHSEVSRHSILLYTGAASQLEHMCEGLPCIPESWF